MRTGRDQGGAVWNWHPAQQVLQSDPLSIVKGAWRKTVHEGMESARRPQAMPGISSKRHCTRGCTRSGSSRRTGRGGAAGHPRRTARAPGSRDVPSARTAASTRAEKPAVAAGEQRDTLALGASACAGAASPAPPLARGPAGKGDRRPDGPSPPTLQFVRNVGPRMSRRLPWGPFFVPGRFLTALGARCKAGLGPG